MLQPLLRLLRQNAIFDYAVLYSNQHPDLEPGFAADDKMLQEFRSFLDERDFELSMLEGMDEALLRRLYDAGIRSREDLEARISTPSDRHRLAREGKVRAAVEGGARSFEDILARAYDDAPRHVWPIAALSVEAHLRKLVDDGELVREGRGAAPRA